MASTPKLSLRAARMNVGLSRKAAELFGVHYMTITKYEVDSENIPRSFFKKIPEIYGVPNEQIYFGKEEEYVQLQVNCYIKSLSWSRR